MLPLGRVGKNALGHLSLDFVSINFCTFGHFIELCFPLCTLPIPHSHVSYYWDFYLRENFTYVVSLRDKMTSHVVCTVTATNEGQSTQRSATLSFERVPYSGPESRLMKVVWHALCVALHPWSARAWSQRIYIGRSVITESDPIYCRMRLLQSFPWVSDPSAFCLRIPDAERDG